jgi:hypothetical protein
VTKSRVRSGMFGRSLSICLLLCLAWSGTSSWFAPESQAHTIAVSKPIPHLTAPFPAVGVVDAAYASIPIGSASSSADSQFAPASHARAKISMVPGTVNVPQDVEEAIRQALIGASDILPGSDHYSISGLRVEEDWRFVSIAGLKGLDEDKQWTLTEHANWLGLVLLHKKMDGRWVGATEGTDEYSLLLKGVPESIITNESRQDLDPKTRTHTSTSALGLK